MIPNEPEYSGFNTKKAQESGKMLEKATRGIYFPLIDAKPSDPSTMMTAAMELTERTGQATISSSSRYQLYKVSNGVP